jgi:hypothetical protein
MTLFERQMQRHYASAKRKVQLDILHITLPEA